MNKKISLIGKNLGVIILLFLMMLSADYADAQKSNEVNNRFNVVVVLDGSNSMRYTDPNGLRYEAIGLFVNLLAEKGNTLGGVVFSNHVKGEPGLAAVNNQSDKDSVVKMLESVEPEGYTNIGEALTKAVSLIETSGNSELPSVIVFLSDGNTEMPTDEELEESLSQKAEAIVQAREKEISIYSVCLNANNRADSSEMKQISVATNGAFQEVTKAEDLKDVFNTFYSLIYGTSTITLVDEEFPDSGYLETPFDVPGLGVEEVNIVIYGKTKSASVVRPDGTNSKITSIASDSFTLIKMTDIIAGRWKLITEGTPKDHIKINMVYNIDLCIDVEANPDKSYIETDDEVTVRAILGNGSTKATNSSQYFGYSAELQILDAYGSDVEKIPMQVVGNCFEAKHCFEEGVYYYKVYVTGNYLEKMSDSVGPLTVSVPKPVEEIKINMPPVPVKETIEEDVYLWPLKGGSFTLDLHTLAIDEEDNKLRYKIMSSSFMEGSDYRVEEDCLVQEEFSLRKGTYTVRATDSGGLFCDIEVVVETHNVGMMALIGLGIGGLIVLIILGVLLYISLTKPFVGTISVQSYCNGSYQGTPRMPKRGRCKLSVFRLAPTGLDYNKSYFQATGQQFIYLNTNVPVIYNGQRTNKLRIQSGAEVSVMIREDSSNMLYIRFDSRMRGSSGNRHRRPNRRR